MDPHPENAKVVPASVAATEGAKNRKQSVSGIRVTCEDADDLADGVKGVDVNA